MDFTETGNDIDSVDDVSDVSDTCCDEIEEEGGPDAVTFCDDLQFVAQIAQEAMVEEQHFALCNDPSESLDMEEAAESNNDDQCIEEREGIDDASSSSSSSDDEEEGGIGAGDDMLDADDEEDTAGAGKSGPLRTKNEILEDVVSDVHPVPEIPSATDITLVGEVLYHIPAERSIIIQAMSNTEPMDEGSLLCLSDKTPIGRIHEVFGPLSRPFYVVKSQPPATKSVTVTVTSTPSANATQKDSLVPEVVASDGCEDMRMGLEEGRAGGDTEGGEEGTQQTPSESTTSTTNDIAQHDNSPIPSSTNDHPSLQLIPGTHVFAPVGSSTFVTPLSLQTVLLHNRKGTDASNFYDEEVCVLGGGYLVSAVEVVVHMEWLCACLCVCGMVCPVEHCQYIKNCMCISPV